MIYTVTLNPALDYVVSVPNFQSGEVNRTQSEKILPGGKGINVSVVLQHLGVENAALGFIGGFIGEEIERLVRATGCRTDFIRVEGNSRINVKLKAGQESEINGQGPQLNETDFRKLLEKTDSMQKGDTLLLAGSIPKGMSEDTYAVLCERVAGRGVRLVADTTGKLLLSTLPFEPFLIKPNQTELEEIMGQRLVGQEKLLSAAKYLQEQGARNVLISMAGEGALLVTDTKEVHQMKAPKGTAVNSVGAGDSMVAGFLAGYERSGHYKTALEMGIAAGSASAFSAELATRAEVDALLEVIRSA